MRQRSLRIEEAALTGESLPVEKQTEPLATETILADRTNLAFVGTLVTYGQAEGVVFATGDRTEMGHIAGLIGGAEELQTPLTRKIAHFSRLLLYAIAALAVLIFVKGAVETLAEKCDDLLTESGGIEPLDKARVLRQADEMAAPRVSQ